MSGCGGIGGDESPTPKGERSEKEVPRTSTGEDRSGSADHPNGKVRPPSAPRTVPERAPSRTRLKRLSVGGEEHEHEHEHAEVEAEGHDTGTSTTGRGATPKEEVVPVPAAPSANGTKTSPAGGGSFRVLPTTAVGNLMLSPPRRDSQSPLLTTKSTNFLGSPIKASTSEPPDRITMVQRSSSARSLGSGPGYSVGMDSHGQFTLFQLAEGTGTSTTSKTGGNTTATTTTGSSSTTKASSMAVTYVVHVSTLLGERFFLKCNGQTLVHYLKKKVGTELQGAPAPWQQAWIVHQSIVLHCKMTIADAVTALMHDPMMHSSISTVTKSVSSMDSLGDIGLANVREIKVDAVHAPITVNLASIASIGEDEVKERHIYIRVLRNVQAVGPTWKDEEAGSLCPWCCRVPDPKRLPPSAVATAIASPTNPISRDGDEMEIGTPSQASTQPPHVHSASGVFDSSLNTGASGSFPSFSVPPTSGPPSRKPSFEDAARRRKSPAPARAESMTSFESTSPPSSHGSLRKSAASDSGRGYPPQFPAVTRTSEPQPSPSPEDPVSRTTGSTRTSGAPSPSVDTETAKASPVEMPSFSPV